MRNISIIAKDSKEKTFNQKEILKQNGYKYLFTGTSKAWAKIVENLEQGKAEVDFLKNLGLSASIGIEVEKGSVLPYSYADATQDEKHVCVELVKYERGM